MGQFPPPGGDDRSSIPPAIGAPGRPPAREQPPLPPTLGPPPALPSEPGRKRWWLAAAIALFVYLFLALVTLVQPVRVAGLSLAVPVPGLSTERLFGLPDGPFTVMVVGLDARPAQEGGPARTDSILLIRVDSGRNRAGILSIPRDSMMQVPYPDGSLIDDRINTAFVYNWSSDDEEAAPSALAATIEHNLGLKVDYYLIFDQRGAAKIIDAAGGVTVSVRESFGQDNYSDDDVNVIPQYFEQGKRHLNGYEAVAYGRIREGSSDFDRIIRQQQVAEALVEQFSSPLSLRRVPGVWGAYNDAVDTDLGRRQTAGLFVLLKRIGTDRVVTRSLGDAARPCNYCSAALLLLDPDETARLIGEAFGDDEVGRNAAALLLAAGVTP